VITVGAELDGGLGRPSVIGLRFKDTETAALSHSQTELWSLTNCPVVIIPGIDHSSFCPGTIVPGDIYPADVDQSAGLALIGDTIAAFLTLHTAGADQTESVE